MFGDSGVEQDHVNAMMKFEVFCCLH